MDVMTEESFGPVVGIMKVENDEEALTLMNDSQYGLVSVIHGNNHTCPAEKRLIDWHKLDNQTASVWTNPKDPNSISVFQSFVEDLECGTVYLNRADALDPAVPWTGVKNSGRGISLSTLGYDQLTRAKGVMMRVVL